MKSREPSRAPGCLFCRKADAPPGKSKSPHQKNGWRKGLSRQKPQRLFCVFFRTSRRNIEKQVGLVRRGYSVFMNKCLGMPLLFPIQGVTDSETEALPYGTATPGQSIYWGCRRFRTFARWHTLRCFHTLVCHRDLSKRRQMQGTPPPGASPAFHKSIDWQNYLRGFGTNAPCPF